ncbi:MAG: GTP-binding protein [Candidatus Lokiarchaeota archaeon]|nr:GTP-binding protein [Candidatus Lokiarchaeota archaeon]
MSLAALVKVKSSFKLKILVVGSANSGKTSFCSKYSDSFSQRFRETIGVDIFVKEELLPDGKFATLSCWNCASQKRFNSSQSLFFRGALGAFVLFSVNNLESYEVAKRYIEDIRKRVNSIPILLIGNKIDLESERRVNYYEVKEYANKLKLAGYIETSTKDDINISKAYAVLSEIIYIYLRSGIKEFDVDILDPNIRNKIDDL